nr:hypothetical protein [Rosenbergiella nectarea]
MTASLLYSRRSQVRHDRQSDSPSPDFQADGGMSGIAVPVFETTLATTFSVRIAPPFTIPAPPSADWLYR